MIIHIIGLPGAGKTTLSKKLSKKFDLPIYRIGEYRAKFPMSGIGELDSWLALFNHLSARQWCNCILETTGLNYRENFLKEGLPVRKLVTIKLLAKRKILYERVNKKKKSDQGGEWLFSREYHNKHEFIRKMFKHFKDVPALIKIDTTERSPSDVYKLAMEKLKLYIE